MPPFRRKKSGKSFPVKVCTLDAELEFSLEVSFYLNYLVTLLLSNIMQTTTLDYLHYSGDQREEICSIWSVVQ